MLITEHPIPNTRKATPSRTVQRVNPTRTAPQPRLESKALAAQVLKLMAKAGDRQSWLLLALVLIPVIGMIGNFVTYGFER